MGSRNHTNTTQFSRVPRVTMPRSTFDLSRGNKFTATEGHLTPFFLQEILPGDTFKVTPHFLVRLATPLKPFMDNLYMDYQFFFVPNRLVWNNWERFNGAQDNPGDSIDFLTPKLFSPSPATGFIAGVGNNPFDYFGLPTGAEIPNNLVQAMPFRMLNLIWNEWFRDQNYADSLPVPKDDGPDDADIYADIQQYIRFKRHDYFTSLLPQPQKGPTVQIPLGGYTNVTGVFGTQSITRAPNATSWTSYDTGTNIPGVGPATLDINAGGTVYNAGTGTQQSFDPNGGLQVSLTNTTGLTVPLFGRIDDNIGTIPNLTTAFLIQNYLERNNRGGTRYIEYIKSQFGVTNPDFRLQRPELLTTGSMQINVNPVMQTAPSLSGETPQGNLAAYAMGLNGGKGSFNHSFTEHGYVIGLLSFRAPYTYQNRLDKSWTRNSRSDFYVPALANLTEQPVLRHEMQYLTDVTLRNYVLGYQERWGEYKAALNQLSGFMKMQPPASPITSLSYWHLAQYFGDDPQFINEGFLREAPPIPRVISIEDEPHFIVDSHFEIHATRVMPTYNLPATLSRF